MNEFDTIMQQAIARAGIPKRFYVTGQAFDWNWKNSSGEDLKKTSAFRIWLHDIFNSSTVYFDYDFTPKTAQQRAGEAAEISLQRAIARESSLPAPDFDPSDFWNREAHHQSPRPDRWEDVSMPA